MNLEQAFYLKLLMEVGITDEFDLVLNEMLEEENPLSNLALLLFDCNDNRNKQIQILNEYINNNVKQLDTDSVFNMIIDKLKSIYDKNQIQIEQISEWMHIIAFNSELWEKQPWNTMYLMNDYYYMSKTGVIDKDKFMTCFSHLLNLKECVNPL